MEKLQSNVSRMIMRNQSDVSSDENSVEDMRSTTTTNRASSSLILLPKKQDSIAPQRDAESDYSDESDELAHEEGAVFLSDLIDEDDDEEFPEDENNTTDSDNDMARRRNLDSDSEEDDNVKLSIDERRIKTAQHFIQQMQDMNTGSDSTHDIEKELKQQRELLTHNKDTKLNEITQRLMDGSLKTEQIFLKGHKNSVTCCTLVDQDPHTVYTGGKDCCILRWDLNSQKKMLFSKGRRSTELEGGGHEGQILTMDVSRDGKYLISGGMDNVIKVWDTRSGQLLNDLDGHYAKITGLSFRKGTYEFYSGSEDRTVRVWDAEEQAFAASLYGHTDGICDLHALEDETCISVGADTSVRFWKVDQETQLLYKGHNYSVDCARMVNQGSFITGSQDGSVCYWGRSHQKPQHRFPDAHGGKWITSVAAVPHGDLLASGSSDGYIRLYNYSPKKGLQMFKSLPQHGYVNCMEFAMRPGASQNRFMVYGVGLDHRLGRWERINKVKNGLGIVRFVEA